MGNFKIGFLSGPFAGGLGLRVGCRTVGGAILAVVALLMTPGSVHAQTRTWASNGSTQSGTSVWSSTSNWIGGVVANGTNVTATFTATVNTFAGLTGDIALGNLTTNSGRIYITGTDTSFATQTPSAYKIAFATTTGTLPAITNVGRIDMLATVAGSQGITKSGAGTVYMWAPNVYSGVTTISTGQIYLRNGSGLGGTGSGNGTVVQSGAALRLDASMTTDPEPLTISGSGVSNVGALRTNTAGTIGDFTGPITLAGNAYVTASPGTALTLSGAIALGGNTLLLGDSGGLAISGGIGGTGGVTYQGNGTAGLVLSGSNTYTGLTQSTNTSAILSVMGYLTGSTSIGGAGNSYLAGTGTLAGGLNVGASNFLSPGATGTAAADSYGTLTTSNLSVQSATVLLGIQDSSTYDRLVMTAGSAGLTLGGSANLVLDFANELPSGTLSLLSFTGLSGNFSGVTSTGFYAGTWTNSSGEWSLANVGTGGIQTLTYSQSTGALAIVPEPSTIVLLSGLAVALSRLRPRRHGPS